VAKKQQQIPGTGPDVIDEMDELCDPDDLDARSASEAQARRNRRLPQIEAVMVRLGLSTYVFQDGDRRREYYLAPGKTKLKTRELEPDE